MFEAWFFFGMQWIRFTEETQAAINLRGVRIKTYGRINYEANVIICCARLTWHN